MSWYNVKYPSSGEEPSVYVPPTWADGTDEEIAEALQKHYDWKIDLTQYWAVGDERVVHLSAMSDTTYAAETHAAQDVVLVLSNVGGLTLTTPIKGHRQCAFQVDQKDSLNERGTIIAQIDDFNWYDCQRRTWCNLTYKNAFPATLQPIFKEFINSMIYPAGAIINKNDYFSLRSEMEITGATRYSKAEGSQISYYTTSINKRKKCNGTNTLWALRSTYNDPNDWEKICYITNNGDISVGYPTGSFAFAPFGAI